MVLLNKVSLPKVQPTLLRLAHFDCPPPPPCATNTMASGQPPPHIPLRLVPVEQWQTQPDTEYLRIAMLTTAMCDH